MFLNDLKRPNIGIEISSVYLKMILQVLNYLILMEKLGEAGLIGKIRLNSAMTVEEVTNEIRSVFGQPMGQRSDFPFVFLQPTGAGSRTLTIPSTSSTFSWTASQVAKLGGYKQTIYILAQEKLSLDNDFSEVSIAL